MCTPIQQISMLLFFIFYPGKLCVGEEDLENLCKLYVEKTSAEIVEFHVFWDTYMYNITEVVSYNLWLEHLCLPIFGASTFKRKYLKGPSLGNVHTHQCCALVKWLLEARLLRIRLPRSAYGLDLATSARVAIPSRRFNLGVMYYLFVSIS
jgi:hypothetical protein